MRFLRLRTQVSAIPLMLPAAQALAPDPITDEIAAAPVERGWMQTFSGRKFYPLHPRPEDVELADIAHGLAHVCRYGGHPRTFYSVAEHCVHVCDVVGTHALNAGHSFEVARAYAQEALLHDSSEAYIGDMIRPLKHQPEMLEFRKAEAKIEAAVFERFGIRSTEDSHEVIKAIDNRILVDEITQLMPDPGMYLDGALADESPIGITIRGWQPERAKREFLERFRTLFS